MKKHLSLSAALILFCLTSFAQNIANPKIGSQDDPNAKIVLIKTDNLYSMVQIQVTASSDSAWAVLNKEIYLQTDVDNKHYEYVKSEGIAVAPAKRHTFTQEGQTVMFKVYFKKIPANAKVIDVIERAGQRTDGITFFNFYNVSLKEQTTDGDVITDVRITAPGGGSPFLSQGSDTSEGGNNLFGGMGGDAGIGNMYKTMIKSMMDAQISYYKEPGKMAELAALNKQYFDALVKQGFTEDQALKLAAAAGLGPKAGFGDNK
jgi:hypothetical protein